jgi:hypothetical protein
VTDLEAVLRRELAAAVPILDPSDTAALTAIRRRILDQAQAYRWEPWRLRPCGTTAAYRRHLRHAEVPCLQCTDANAADWRDRNPNPDGTGRRPRNRRKGTT